MIFELKKDPEAKTSTYQELVEQSISKDAKVRVLTQVVAVEC